MTSKLCSSKESVLKTLEQCNKLKAKYNDIFSENIRTGRTVTGAIQQNKSHKRKALKRRLKRLKINCDYIMQNVCSVPISSDYLDFTKAKTVNDLVTNCNEQPTNNVDISCVQTIGLKHVKGLFVLIETNL